ncbi:hypothetical protein [Pontibacter chitinilyticus]|uniref:hypothetical protein n=1 Tax=Pontibacter chitinilyticus TaxID=2674989 RepID=UPI0032195126
MKAFLRAVFLSLFLAVFLLSCSQADKEDQQTAEREQALTEYRNFVTQFEQDSLSEVELRAMQQADKDSTSWAEQKQMRQQQFQQLKDNVQTNAAAYEPGERNEILDLEQRYNQAEEKHQQQYDDVSRRYMLRNELLGLEVSTDDLSEITAANITGVYQQFVQTLAQKADQLDNRSWEMVEGWWNALNNRRLEVADNLSAADKNAVEAAAKQYQQLIARKAK